MFETLLYNIGIDNVNISERVNVYEAACTIVKTNLPDFNFFSNIINIIPERDTVKISLLNDSEEHLIITRDRECRVQYEKFVEDSFEDETIKIRIDIWKAIKENKFSVYSFDRFCNDLLSRPIEENIKIFSDFFKEAEQQLVFEIFSTFSFFMTKTMFFIAHDSSSMVPNSFDRKKRIESCRETSYFYNFDVYELVPDDFNIEVDYEGNPLTGLSQKIETVLSLALIANSSSIRQAHLAGAINGQRTIEYEIDLNEVINNKFLYSIFNWIHTDGNSIDKAIIARNVISLHCRQIPIIELNESVVASIQSNYNLYLKNNVTQYLELKNKVAEFICEEVSKTGEYATKLLDKLKTNLFAILGFLFTTVLANIVSDQPLDNIFTKDIVMLLQMVLSVSFIYMFICIVQLIYEFRGVCNSYIQLKESYQNILTERDIEEIFKEDIVFEKAKKQVKIGCLVLTTIWLIMLSIGMKILNRLGEGFLIAELMHYFI